MIKKRAVVFLFVTFVVGGSAPKVAAYVAVLSTRGRHPRIPSGIGPARDRAGFRGLDRSRRARRGRLARSAPALDDANRQSTRSETELS